MQLTVNGVTRELASPPLSSLLHVLREELGVTSPKAGCQQGGCGSCTILVDGAPRRACLLPVAALDGAEITTLEGLGSPEALSPIQTAFHSTTRPSAGSAPPAWCWPLTGTWKAAELPNASRSRWRWPA